MKIANECYQQTNNNGNENETDDIFIVDSLFRSVPTAIVLNKKFPDGKSIGEAAF